MNEPNIYQLAVDVFGEDAQIGQLHEEIGELMKAINKHRRFTGLDTRYDVIEETVDLMIMCEQMKCIFDTNGRFDEMMQYKLARLSELLDDVDELRRCENLNTETAEYDDQIERLIQVRLDQ